VAGLRDQLVAGVLERVQSVTVNGHPSQRLPGIANLTFAGCEGDALLMLLDAHGVECSTGSACSAGVAQPSHVLTAMGAGHAEARGTLRFSLGHDSSEADVRAALDAIAPSVERARRAGLTSVAS
jgi:cysteine desulfurase